MFRTTKNSAATSPTLGTDDVVLDRSAGTLRYRNAAGALVTALIVQPASTGAKTLLLAFAATGNATAPALSVLENTTTLGAPSGITRSGVGTYQVTLPGGSNQYPIPQGRGVSEASGQSLQSAATGRSWNGSNTYLTFELRNAAGTLVDGGPSDEWVHAFIVR